MSFEQVLESALALTALERVRLMERLMESLVPHLKPNTAQTQQSRQSLYELWQSLNLPPEDIDELRRGTWEGFGNESLRNRPDESNGSTVPPPSADDDVG